MTTTQNKINWKDSNLALFGSDLEKKIKASAAEKEEAWEGLEWPKKKYGKFHKGDSYIILNTSKPDSASEKLEHDIHIWIGEESSQDEYGTSAYKMVELDDFLGGTATQHREIQGKESDLFLSYFGHITYWEGGIESGFRHVEPTKDEPHLFRIKGSEKSHSLRLTQVPLRRDCINSGDVFILSAGDDQVWMWVGKEANNDEKAKGTQVAEVMCSKGSVEVLDEGVNDGPKEAETFWKHIQTEVSTTGSAKRTVSIQSADNKDDKGKAFVPTLFKAPETLGKGFAKICQAKPTATGPTKVKLPKLNKSLLEEDEVLLLDTGFRVFVWLGTKADPSRKSVAVLHADSYFKSKKRPMLPVSIVKQDRESAQFSDFFVENTGGCSCMIM
ncbi:unnamed protein product [Cylindrotheca closterium]|uniref:Gelsolin-like domain-containing protein n=1 Tax=Cylindrotheca closterium TaxID=2856 RepID=A0AAD2CD08_9STRA|nr:unnamed protein product [Cylindrotheca closterium]